MTDSEIKTTQTSADMRTPAILLGGPHEGKRTHVSEPAPSVLNCAPLRLFPAGVILGPPRPPWWRPRARARWVKWEPAPPEPPRPPVVYRLAGTLDDGTRIYRYGDD